MAAAVSPPAWVPQRPQNAARGLRSRRRRPGGDYVVATATRNGPAPGDSSTGGAAPPTAKQPGSNSSGSATSWQPTGGDGSLNALPPTSSSRRGLLQLATAGSLYAWAARSAAAADQSLAATAAGVAAAGGGGVAMASSSSRLLERQLEERLSEFTLSNGLRFLVFERHEAPIVSAHIHADVGAFDEVDGQTGLAHLLEHMAFKGTQRVGTTDYRREAPLLDALDETFYSLLEAGSGREAGRLQQQFEALQKQAASLSVPNAYGSLLSQEGGVGLNASTNHDATKYYVSLPANKLELWMALEGERFQAPVFRELYSEKQVVFEERRLRVDNSPLGPFSEQFALASLTNNYRRPVIGFPEDLSRIGRREVQQFFQHHYGPSSLTIAIAGDVKPEQVRRLAERYWGGWRQPPGSLPPSRCRPAAGGEEPLPSPAGPPQGWQYSAKSKAGPAVMHAYYRPCIRSPDSIPLDLTSDLLSSTRTSRLYRGLVAGGKALTATSFASYPAEKHPSHFVVYGIPSRSSSLAKLDAELDAEVAALAGEGPTEGELRRYKKAARVELLGALGSNSAVASALADYQVLTDDWRNVLTDLERIQSLTPADVRDVAARHLRPDNCFKGYVLPVSA